jgi:predicted ATP-grasp superfamily ATP-dependent carboligase
MSNEMSREGALVIGGHIQGLGITRILGSAGIPVVLLDQTKYNITRFSKYCKSFFKVKNEDLITKLKHFKEHKFYEGWVIYPTNDAHVELLSKNKEQLEPYFRVTTDRWESVSIFYDKKKTYQLASKLDIPIAKTFFPDALEDLLGLKVEFPCIIKPAVMHSFYAQTSQKVFVCRDIQSLQANYIRASELIPKEEIIVQEIIQGPSKNQFSACFLFLNKQSYIWLTACRMRQHPIDFGNATTYAETVDLPELKIYAERILAAANYNGLCEVEFKLDSRDNTYKFLEVNTRTWKWHAIANKAETPFVKTYFDFLIGKDIEKTTTFKHASFRHLVTDFPTQLKLWKLGFDYAFRRQDNCENAVYDSADIKPWIMEKILLPFLIFTRS